MPRNSESKDHKDKLSSGSSKRRPLSHLQREIEDMHERQMSLVKELALQQTNIETQTSSHRKLCGQLTVNMSGLKKMFVAFEEECRSEWVTINQELLAIVQHIVTLYQLKVSTLESQLAQTHAENHALQQQNQTIMSRLSLSKPEDSITGDSGVSSGFEQSQDNIRKIKISDVIASYQSSIIKENEPLKTSEIQQGIDLADDDYSSLFSQTPFEAPKPAKSNSLQPQLKSSIYLPESITKNNPIQTSGPLKYSKNNICFDSQTSRDLNHTANCQQDIENVKYSSQSSRKRSQGLQPSSNTRMQQLRRSLFGRRASRI